jgi:hypothetical protein
MAISDRLDDRWFLSSKPLGDRARTLPDRLGLASCLDGAALVEIDITRLVPRDVSVDLDPIAPGSQADADHDGVMIITVKMKENAVA